MKPQLQQEMGQECYMKLWEELAMMARPSCWLILRLSSEYIAIMSRIS